MHKALAFLARDCGFGVPSGVRKSRVVQRKRAGPITQRSVDRNYALLKIFLLFISFSICLLVFAYFVCLKYLCPISAEDSALDF